MRGTSRMTLRGTTRDGGGGASPCGVPQLQSPVSRCAHVPPFSCAPTGIRLQCAYPPSDERKPKQRIPFPRGSSSAPPQTGQRKRRVKRALREELVTPAAFPTRSVLPRRSVMRADQRAPEAPRAGLASPDLDDVRRGSEASARARKRGRSLRGRDGK